MADPQTTRALVNRYLDALNTSDFDAIGAIVHEDVAHDPGRGGRQVGRDALLRYLMDEARHHDERASDIAVMVDEHGGRAAAEFTLRGVYRETVAGLPAASNQSYSLRAGLFFEIDDGEITRVSADRDHEAWLAQIA